MYLSHLAIGILMVHRRDKFRAQKSLAARVLANPKIEVRFNTELRKIEGSPVVDTVHAGEQCHGQGMRGSRPPPSFIFIGSDPKSSLVAGLGVAMDDVGYIETNQKMETGVPGLYAVGDVRASPFRQLVVAAAEGGDCRPCCRPVHRRAQGRAVQVKAFRLIVHPKMEGRLDMAIDEALSEAVGRGESPPSSASTGFPLPRCRWAGSRR